MVTKSAFQYTPPAALTGSVRDFRSPKGSDLQTRSEAFFKWQDLRRRHDLWPYSRSTDESPSTVTAGRNDAGERFRGVNFASQDYLSLSSHPAIKKTAQAVIEDYGVHSAGSPALLGNTSHSVVLERRVADFMGMPDAVLFPTGWAAGYGVIKGLVRPRDWVVIDALAHACLQEGANAATRNLALFRHNQIEECRDKLAMIRERDVEAGIMVVTESLFSMDSDTPDLGAMQALCDEYDATLVVDVAHDLGCMGEDGRGHIGMQGVLGKLDLVMGSFSKTFGSNGGFVACRSRALKEYLRFYSPSCTFSNALSPAQAATVLKAFDIIESRDGEQLRGKLMRNILSLRRQLVLAGFEVYGEPSPIVCVKMGSEALARLVSRRLPEAGLIANLVEFPAVPKGQARFRMQVMADHTEQNIADAVAALRTAYSAGSEEFDWTNREAEQEELRQTA